MKKCIIILFSILSAFSIGIGFVHNLVEEHLTGRFDLTDENIEKAFLITWNMMAKEVN
jgi:hypothetical protein